MIFKTSPYFKYIGVNSRELDTHLWFSEIALCLPVQIDKFTFFKTFQGIDSHRFFFLFELNSLLGTFFLLCGFEHFVLKGLDFRFVLALEFGFSELWLTGVGFTFWFWEGRLVLGFYVRIIFIHWQI